MRKLTQVEKDNLKKLRRTEGFIIGYVNVVKILSPIIWLIVFWCISSGGKYKEFLVIGVIVAIANVIAISKVQTKMCNNLNKDLDCIDTEMIKKEEKSMDVSDAAYTKYTIVGEDGVKREVTPYRRYVTVEIDGELKDVEYEGKKFSELQEGDNMVAIKLVTGEWICYSYTELNY